MSRVAHPVRDTQQVVDAFRRRWSVVWNGIERGIGMVRAAVLFRRCVCGKRVFAEGYVRVRADGAVRIGDQVQFVAGMIPSEIVCREAGALSIGSRSILNYAVSIEASRSVQIGAGCMLGSMVRIRDRNELETAPVVIGDEVWISHGAIVEPGVTIGDGAVVSAGSVVRSSVPPHSLAVGNPATSMPLDRVLSRRLDRDVVASLAATNPVEASGPPFSFAQKLHHRA